MATAWNGEVISLFVTSAGSQPMEAREEVSAVPGKGLEGDRYLLGTGFYSAKPATGRELTLFEEEVLSALAGEHDIPFTGAETRRNIITRGAPLNHLVGREFVVGEVTLKGVRLCEPCRHLVELTGKHVLGPLVHRGGLRVDILTTGVIRIGDAVLPS